MISGNKSMPVWALWAVVVVAAGLRVVGVGFGLPDLFHQDEPILVNHAMAIGAGGWNPHFFILPPFCMYFLFIVYAAGFVLLKITHQVPDAAAYAALFLKDPSGFYWTARLLLGVGFGTAAVWLIGRRASALLSQTVGFLAAFFLAFLPLHVRHSHYAYTDAAVTFALTLFWLELIRLARAEGGRGAYVRAGAALGWAVSIKYTAAYTAPVFLLAWAMREQGKIKTRAAWTGALLFAGASLGTFALIAPYTFLDWSSFWRQIHHQASAESALPFFHHLRYSLMGGAGPAFLILAAAGMGVLLVRRPKDGWITVVFVAVFYGVNSFFGQPYARYVLPLTPALCVAAAVGWEAFFKLRARAMQLLALSFVLLFFIPTTLWSDGLFVQPDTRTLCREWIERNVPVGASVILDSRSYGPRLAQTAEQVREKYARLGPGAADAVRRKRLDLELEIAGFKKSYRVFTLSEVQSDSFLFQEPLIAPDRASIRQVNPDYLVVNRAEFRPAVAHLLSELSPEMERAAFFSPYRRPGHTLSADSYASTAAPDLPREIFSRKSLGPYLEIYRFKKSGQQT